MNLSAHILKIAKAAKKFPTNGLVSASEKARALINMAQALEVEQSYLIRKMPRFGCVLQTQWSKALIGPLDP